MENNNPSGSSENSNLEKTKIDLLNSKSIDSEIPQYLLFQLENDIYGLDILKVREILDIPPITKVPQSPEYLLGVINLRGSVVPVVELSIKFKLERDNKNSDSCIIIVEKYSEAKTRIFGIIVDSVHEVIELAEDEIEPVSKIGTSIDINFISGVGKINNKFVILLEMEKILSEVQIEN